MSSDHENPPAKKRTGKQGPQGEKKSKDDPRQIYPTAATERRRKQLADQPFSQQGKSTEVQKVAGGKAPREEVLEKGLEFASLATKKKRNVAQAATLAQTPPAGRSKKGSKKGKTTPVQPATLPRARKSQPPAGQEEKTFTFVPKSANNPSMWVTAEGKRQMERDRRAAEKKAQRNTKAATKSKAPTPYAGMSDDDDLDNDAADSDDDEQPTKNTPPLSTGNRSAANQDEDTRSPSEGELLEEEEEEEGDEGDQVSVTYGSD